MIVAGLFLSCGNETAPSSTPVPAVVPSGSGTPAVADEVETKCRARVEALLKEAGLPGAPEFEKERANILGRARGEPMVFIRAPKAIPETKLPKNLRATKRTFERSAPGTRVRRLARSLRGNREAMRALLLREGYLYTSNPHDALAMVTALRVASFFDEDEVWLQRGTETFRLRKTKHRRETVYLYDDDGPAKGETAGVLFGDRLAATREGLAAPLHRDLRRLAREQGFDRTRILHRTKKALLAELRFGERWVVGLIEADGATLRHGCFAEPAGVRTEIDAWKEANEPRLRAIRAMQRTVSSQVYEAMRFDRPREEPTAELDGALRPLWRDAYLRGAQGFSHDGRGYAVYDQKGRAWPPQVCVDFVLDTYERTSGTWFRDRGSPPARVVGKLDFNSYGIKNRRGVIAFMDFAAEHPDLFHVLKFQGEDRIRFARRSDFFGFLLKHADLFRPGDVAAIHGRKRDGLIHQHAIFVEDTDPVTGFPYGLADQMKRPRRRTWEGIMAEAPQRSLFYRVRPRDSVLSRLDSSPEPDPASKP